MPEPGTREGKRPALSTATRGRGSGASSTCLGSGLGVGGRTLVLADDVPVRLGRHLVHGTDLVAAEGVADLLDDRLDVEPVRLVAEGGAYHVGGGLGEHALGLLLRPAR